MGRKTKVALTVGAASVAAWAASKVVVKQEPRAEKKALQFSEIAVLANVDIAEDPSVHLLTAYTNAADLGVHGFAVNIRLTKDEEIILAPSHDLQLTGVIADYTLAELQNEKLPVIDDSESLADQEASSIVSLRELLETFPQLLHVISMSDSPDTYEGSLIPSKLWRLLKEMDAADRVVVTSSYDEQIDRFNLYAQNSVALGAGNEEIKKAYVAYSSKFGHLYKPNADLFCLPEKIGVFPLASDGFVQFLQQLNITVLYELTNTVDIQKLSKLEIAGFITTEPKQVLSYFNEN
ncbi:glycerophosphodiester phosphodiesterase [Sporosarcina newyorkensis]|uniref:Glycerophosphoryl diester phosphodiesterase n=2 Tax=Sporosarcina newyorkensis TaxID=759851 RepID=A0A1T4YH14_9BACL|nr:glycerophosphodiester phosphodiesterase [Sporosarcina newyorkensis]EGQ27307.1 glycerophosphodiester phosphodiesterase [Sporosarcina newyorkensis 2681]SKB00525.1 glycerophosphoryl diester phosphodiesterase [Sporosarcina newyorkensis]